MIMKIKTIPLQWINLDGTTLLNLSNLTTPIMGQTDIICLLMCCNVIQHYNKNVKQRLKMFNLNQRMGK